MFVITQGQNWHFPHTPENINARHSKISNFGREYFLAKSEILLLGSDSFGEIDEDKRQRLHTSLVRTSVPLIATNIVHDPSLPQTLLFRNSSAPTPQITSNNYTLSHPRSPTPQSLKLTIYQHGRLGNNHEDRKECAPRRSRS
jgi:hypothetical protein